MTIDSICQEVLKGFFTLAAVGLGSGIGFFVYFRQKEYELTKQRYLEQGIDVIAAAVEAAFGVVSHNFARSLQVCRQYRDLGSQFDSAELERGYLPLDSSNFHQTAHYRVSSLLNDQIIWNIYQSSMAHAASANMLIAQEVPDAIRILAKMSADSRDRGADVEKMTKDLQDSHDGTFKHSTLGRQLHVLALLLEETRLGRRDVATFHKRSEVQAVINSLRETYAEDSAEAA